MIVYLGLLVAAKVLWAFSPYYEVALLGLALAIYLAVMRRE
jgi:hypothetical protein